MTGLHLSLSAESPELVARTRAGDEGAFTALVERYQSIVFRWAIGLSGDEDQAEDIVQEVFVRVHRKLASFRGDGPFDGWLYRITRRVALRMPRPRPSTADGATLPMRQREVFVLCDLEERTPVEVAAMLDMKDVSAPAEQVAARAVVLSRRRTVALYYRIALGVAIAASVSYLIAARQASTPRPASEVSETFHLQCLSPEQAAEVIRSGIASRTMGIRIQPHSTLGIIRVNAPPEEMERARAVLQRYDSPAESQCAVQITLPRVVKVPEDRIRAELFHESSQRCSRRGCS